jgi:hypothetical protein
MGGTVQAYPVTPRGLGFLVELHTEPAAEVDHQPARSTPFGASALANPPVGPSNEPTTATTPVAAD